MSELITHWHVYPEGDLVEHDTNSDECICGPTAELIHHPEGDRWIYTHHSLDGRERHE